MRRLTLQRYCRTGVPLLPAILLVAGVVGCHSSPGPPKQPNQPKIRVEGPAGARFAFRVSYFDGSGDPTFFGTDKTLQSGVWSQDLDAGHQGVVVQVAPNFTATVTVILLDGATEIQRATAKGQKETAMVQAGRVEEVRPYHPWGGR